MKVGIKIQSFVDIITNSSTSVYQIAYGESCVEEIFDALLKAFGVEKKFSDLFRVDIEYCDYAMENYIDSYLGDIIEYCKEESIHTDLIKRYEDESDKPWNVRDNDLEDRLIEEILEVGLNIPYLEMISLSDFVDNHNEDASEFFYESSYKITALDPENKESAEILNRINSLFHYEASFG